MKMKEGCYIPNSSNGILGFRGTSRVMRTMRTVRRPEKPVILWPPSSLMADLGRWLFFVPKEASSRKTGGLTWFNQQNKWLCAINHRISPAKLRFKQGGILKKHITLWLQHDQEPVKMDAAFLVELAVPNLQDLRKAYYEYDFGPEFGVLLGETFGEMLGETLGKHWSMFPMCVYHMHCRFCHVPAQRQHMIMQTDGNGNDNDHRVWLMTYGGYGGFLDLGSP